MTPLLIGSIAGSVVAAIILWLFYYCVCSSVKSPKLCKDESFDVPSRKFIPNFEKRIPPTSSSNQKKAILPKAKASPVDPFLDFLEKSVEAPLKSASSAVHLSTLFKISDTLSFLGAAEPKEPHRRLFSVLRNHDGAISGVSFSPNSQMLVSTCHNGPTRVWKEFDSHPIYISVDHGDDCASTCAFAKNDVILVATEKTLSLQYYKLRWDQLAVLSSLPSRHKPLEKKLPFEKILEFPSGHLCPVKSILIAPTVKGILLTLTRGSEDTRVRVSTPSGALRQMFPVNQLLNYSAALAPSGQVYGIAAKLGDAKVWCLEYASDGDFRALTKMMELRGHSGGVLDIGFSADGYTAVTCDRSGVWRVWNINVRWRDGEDAKLLATYSSSLSTIEFLAVHPQGEDLVALAFENRVHLHRISSGQCVDTIDFAHRGRITCLSFSPDGAFLATGGTDKTVKIWRM